MDKFEFKKVFENFGKLKAGLPIKIGNIALRHYQKSFSQQGFEDVSLIQWQEVRRRIAGTEEYEEPKNKGLGRRTRKILVGTGRLRRDVANSLKKTTFTEIKFIVEAPYSGDHNDGVPSRRIPQRKFMGSSQKLDAKIENEIMNELNKIW